jgi:hypothetical protein
MFPPRSDHHHPPQHHHKRSYFHPAAIIIIHRNTSTNVHISTPQRSSSSTATPPQTFMARSPPPSSISYIQGHESSFRYLQPSIVSLVSSPQASSELIARTQLDQLEVQCLAYSPLLHEASMSCCSRCRKACTR